MSMRGLGTLPPRAPRRRVVVTGIGAVTPLATSAPGLWAALLAGGCGIRAIEPQHAPADFFPPSVTDPAQRRAIVDALACKVAGYVPVEQQVAGGGNAKPKTDRFAANSRSTRYQLFAEAAAEEALRDSGLLVEAPVAASSETQGGPSQSNIVTGCFSGTRLAFDRRFYTPEQCAVNIGVGISSLNDVAEASRALYPTITGGGGSGTSTPPLPPAPQVNKIGPFFVPKILCNTVSGALSIRYGLRGPNHSATTACATGAHCIGDAAAWIQDGRCDMAVCGATEASITPIGLAGFQRMKAMCTKFNDRPSNASRPFDADRAGFVMGEGAGILVLESLDSALARIASLAKRDGAEEEGRGANRSVKIYAEIRGFGMSGDAYHVSSPCPEGSGAERCIRAALADGGVDPRDVGYVNAHATSTPLGDEIELAAITRTLRPLKFYGSGVSCAAAVDGAKATATKLTATAASESKSAATEAAVGVVEPICVAGEATAATTADQAGVGADTMNNSSSHQTPSPLYVSSTKGATGHLLGAAGGVEAIVAVLAAHHGRCPGTLNLQSPVAYDRARVVLPVATATVEAAVSDGTSLAAASAASASALGSAGEEATGVAPGHGDGFTFPPAITVGGGGTHVTVSTSFGFGGTNAALVFASV